MEHGQTWNVALTVTAARIAAIPVLMVLVLSPGIPDHRWWAAGVYLVAAATDSLDGWLARSRGQTTVAGAFLDPLADKLLLSAALVCLVEVDELGAWVVMIIIAREFAVTGLRLVAAANDLIIPADRLGKAKTLSQNLAILARLAPHPWPVIDTPLLALAVAMTVLSGINYFAVAHRRYHSRARSAAA
ncbi:MAG TPA: CDP-diacylglycerol--glycerol-3-phosphate 3-phosphatidyltransferase [Miltoncostaeaceae bacterium]|nr:CDP-diacylglycerol--glycerol-3-phosphate 3-phosphatidyltransferase [Miltoncostaeaceae bacterium]